MKWIFFVVAMVYGLLTGWVLGNMIREWDKYGLNLILLGLVVGCGLVTVLALFVFGRASN